MGLAGRFVFLLLVVAFFVVSLLTSADKAVSISADKAIELNAPEGTVKTLKDAEYGVLIDCVDIYKQPSLKHPLLKDHVVQLEPSSSFPCDPERREVEGKSKRVVYPAGQDWPEDEQCPKGSIPIIRTHKRLGEAASAAVLDRNHNAVDLLRELRLMYMQLRSSVQKKKTIPSEVLQV